MYSSENEKQAVEFAQYAVTLLLSAGKILKSQAFFQEMSKGDLFYSDAEKCRNLLVSAYIRQIQWLFPLETIETNKNNTFKPSRLKQALKQSAIQMEALAEKFKDKFFNGKKIKLCAKKDAETGAMEQLINLISFDALMAFSPKVDGFGHHWSIRVFEAKEALVQAWLYSKAIQTLRQGTSNEKLNQLIQEKLMIKGYMESGHPHDLLVYDVVATEEGGITELWVKNDFCSTRQSFPTRCEISTYTKHFLSNSKQAA